MFAIVDCNSFYAACERVFQPALVHKPVVVLSNNDGCIISRSDEAKQLGLPMAGPFYQVKGMMERKEVAVFSSNYNLYGDMSQRVMETLRSLAPNVEVYSVDESFLDVREVPTNQLLKFAKRIRDTVESWTGIPVSVGVAPTKVLSKVANKLAKENKKATGCVKILCTDGEQEVALKNTRVEEVWGVGRRNAAKLLNMGIVSAWDLRNMPEDWAVKNLGGVVGLRLIRELKGIPCIEIQDQLETKKMIATTRMFGRTVTTLHELKESVGTYTERAASKLRRQRCAALTLNVFLVANDYHDDYEYNPQSHSLTVHLPTATSLTNQLLQYAIPLVDQLYRHGSRYVKAGVILSDLVPEECVQTSMFDRPEDPAMKSLMLAVDNVNAAMKQDMISFATAGTKKEWKMRQEWKSARYTTRWDELVEVG
jgi:DNA polymerase V